MKLFASCGGLKISSMGGFIFRSAKPIKKIPANSLIFDNGDIMTLNVTMGPIKSEIIQAPCGGFYLDTNYFVVRDGVLTAAETSHPDSEYFFANCGGLKCNKGDFSIVTDPENDEGLGYNYLDRARVNRYEFFSYPVGTEFNTIIKNKDGDVMVQHSPNVYYLSLKGEPYTYTATSPEYPDVTLEGTVESARPGSPIILSFDTSKVFSQIWFNIEPMLAKPAIWELEVKNTETGEIILPFDPDIPEFYLLSTNEERTVTYKCTINVSEYPPFSKVIDTKTEIGWKFLALDE